MKNLIIIILAIISLSCTVKRDAYWVVEKTELPNGNCKYIVEASTAFTWTWNDVMRYEFEDTCDKYGTAQMIWCYQLSELYGIENACKN